jgi:2-iminobutanoate/2-iminopropanoate deaminase
MTNIKQVSSKDAPTVVGPYSIAINYADLVFCSGQIGINPKTGNLAVGIEKQTTQVLKNLETVLKAAGSDFEHVLKTTIFIADMNDYAKVNEIYGKTFSKHKPARATVQVAALPRAALIEIEAIATLAFSDAEYEDCCCGDCDCDWDEKGSTKKKTGKKK